MKVGYCVTTAKRSRKIHIVTAKGRPICGTRPHSTYLVQEMDGVSADVVTCQLCRWTYRDEDAHFYSELGV